MTPRRALQLASVAMLSIAACQFDRSGGTGSPGADAMSPDAVAAGDASMSDGQGMTPDGPCGGLDVRCCPGDQCPGSTASTPLYCDTSPDTHVCRACGLFGQRCCPGDMCPGPGSLLCDTSPDPHQCVACGTQGQPCCPGNTCEAGLQCMAHQCN